ncbi:uncharacterized protein I206_106042 [Kwoniella pini CBS 10737]|uniref:C2H2-type domain-containing protein n=1 Tax=Kwoniella pini CBS 10737 TaxID=1296096 RepID=A0A1B9I0X3_9TREE|nr:uncharacterized protein I206_04865 [Kwoniella pini CBS 10737]OCF49177.1 hypothetical protein I206_04865 [Kwoniella pini CBS 10737]
MTSINSSPPSSSPLQAQSSPILSNYDSPKPNQEIDESKPKSKVKSKKKRKSKLPEVELDDQIGDLLGEEELEVEVEEENQNEAGPSISNKGGKKVKTEEIDELADETKVEGDGNQGTFKCEWGDCEEVNGTHNGLIEHVKEDHINALKDAFICEWINCPRTGQKQASRHSLSTHMRMHTGERPYACTYAGCPKSFTRSDALQKHIRSQHIERPPKPVPPPPAISLNQTTPGISKATKNKSKARHAPIASTPLTRTPLNALPISDEDLLLDEDIAEVLPRIRKREILNPTFEEIEALNYLRSIFPRQILDSKNPIPDSLDEPPSELGIPEEAQLIQSVPDPDIPGGELDLLGRSEWQARYIMIKARLMLVEEENSMRRMELLQLLQTA